MVAIGFHASHEQVRPRRLLRDADRAEQRGFEAVTRHVPPSEVAATVRAPADVGLHRQWLEEYVEQGFTELFLHHVGSLPAAA